MALKITDKPNTDAANGEYPYGKIRDNDGTGNGTPVNDEVYGDFHQFFARLMEWVLEYKKSGDTFDWNHLPDNAYNGFQLFEALKRFKPYRYYTAVMNQVGSSAPTATILENNIGTIVWSRSGIGEYAGTLSGAFTLNKTWTVSACGPGGTGGAEVVNILPGGTANSVILRSYDNTGAPADDIIENTCIEIRVYP